MVDGEVIEHTDKATFFDRPAHPRSRDYVRFGS